MYSCDDQRDNREPVLATRFVAHSAGSFTDTDMDLITIHNDNSFNYAERATISSTYILVQLYLRRFGQRQSASQCPFRISVVWGQR